MSFSSFVRQRQFNPAKATSEANKILTDSQKLVDQMRAVNDFELKAQSNLVTNLRQFRQDESRRNTRDNQLIVQGLRQRAAYEQRQAETQARDKAQEIQANEAKLDQQIKTFSQLSQAVGKAFTGEIERAKAEVDEVIAETVNLGYVLDPQTSEQDFLGVDGKLNVQKDQMLLETAQKAAAGKGQLFGLIDIVSDSYVKTQTAKQFALKTANDISGGNLVKDQILNNPDRVVSIVTTDGEEQQIRLGDLRTNPDLTNETFNLVYKTLGFELFKERMQGAGLYDGIDGALFGESFKALNAYANTETAKFSRFQDSKRTDLKINSFVDQVTLATTGDEASKAMVELLNYSSLDPNFSTAEAFAKIEDLIKDMPDPQSAVNQLITRLEEVRPGFSNTFAAKSLRTRANEQFFDNVETQNSQIKLTAEEYVENTLLPAILRDDRYDPAERKLVLDNLRRKNSTGEIPNDLYYAILDIEQDSYEQYKNDDKYVDYYIYMLNTGQMNEEEIEKAFRSGVISKPDRDSILEEVKVLSTAKEQGKLQGWTRSELKNIFYKDLAQRLELTDVDYGPTSLSADIVALRSVEEYQRLYRLYSQSMDPVGAAQKAFTEVQKAISDGAKGSIYEINVHPLAGTDDTMFPTGMLVYGNVLIGGGGSRPVRMPAAPRMTTAAAAYAARTENSAFLQPRNVEYDLMLETYAQQIRNGDPIVLSARDQAIITEAGLTTQEYLTKRFELNGIDIIVPEGSKDVVYEKVKEYPELIEVLKQPVTLPRLNSVIDQLHNIAPAELGTGEQAFNNALSIASKLGSPAPEIVAARYMSDTNGNTNFSSLGGGTPAQYLAKLNNDLLNSTGGSDFTPQTSLNVMLAAVGDGESLRGILNGFGVTGRMPRAGMTTTIARMGNTGRLNSTNLSADIAKGTSRTNLIPMIQQAAMRHNIPAPILAGLLKQETNFREVYLTGELKSDAGAIGAGQFLPATAEEHGINPYDIPSSINGAAKYLRYLVNYFGGDMRLALFAYNGGMGNIRKFNGPIPGNKQNNEYVPLIMNFARRYGYGQ